MDTAATRAREAAAAEHQRPPCAAPCRPGAHLGGPLCRLGKNTAGARSAVTGQASPPVAVPFEVWAAAPC